MTAWLQALPAVSVAAAMLLVPGLLVAVAAGLRGLTAIGLAPPLSVTTVACTAVAAGLVGVPFGVAAVVVGTVVTAGIAVAVSKVLPGTAPSRTSCPSVVAGLAGAAAGGMCAALAVVHGIGQPDVFPQTFDAVFHLSAVWQALHTHDASSLTMGTVAAPGNSSAFYPAAWHGLVVLVAEVSGAPIVVAVSAVSVVVSALVWPLGCVLLARQVAGSRPGALFAAGVLSAAFGASPYLLLSYGTLWPNALANALLPATLACAARLLVPRDRAGQTDGFDRWRAGVFGAVALPGLALAHPNAVLSGLIYVTVMALVALGHWGLSARAGAQPRLVALGGAAALVGAGLWLVAWSPLFAATRHTSWPARQSLAQAVGEWVSAAPMRTPVPWLAAALVLVGCVVAWRRPQLRWLVLAHAAAGGAFVLVAGSDGPVARALSGPWYDDPFRFAALLGVTAVPLAALGLEAGAIAGVRGVRARSHRFPALRPLVATCGLAAVVATLTGGMYAGGNSHVVATWYHGQSLAGPAERAMLERLPQLVPSGELVAGNPWNGSPFASVLGDRAAVFPHVSGSWDPDRVLLASSLNRAEDLPEVCAAARRLDVGYVIDGSVAFWKGDHRQAQYRGLEVAGHPGFEPVAHGGRLTLYRVTACS
ncbi:DUF6541 family protein [Phycicoccus sp. Soil802]|uniref:DUF6541 family protein n=1 Tax=Phycicoccus sp. Soil802 TaxID=1736414 RepID=UPI000702460A|nr:DUF6541 family protein [Phycicoccus sp. Soil802]KRF28451.1 hypothetical protein ASG91_08330 [Phycicoccus sp. Soil802]